VVELHHKHLKIAEIARRFGVSDGTILRVLHRHEAMPPRNATKHEIKIIKRLSKQRRTRDQIAQFLGRSRAFVDNWQRKLHCQRKHEPTEEDKREIIRLYREWKGQARIAKLTGVPQPAVRRVLLEAGIPIHRTGEPRFQLPPDQQERFKRAVLSRKFYCKDLEKEFGLTKSLARRLAKEVLGVPEFLRGAILPRLSSHFPQVDAQPSHYVELVQRISDLCFDGKLLAPQYDKLFVDACLKIVPAFQNQPQTILNCLSANLTAAVGSLRSQRESTWVH